MEVNKQVLEDLANKLRIHSITSTTQSKSGHPTSCSSMAEIMSVLFYHTMQYSLEEPRGVNADRFVLSKGHAAPILYAAWAEAGLFPVSDLMNLRKADSLLEGHPTPRLNFIDVATGSLGQGLSVACGMAYVGKYYDKASYKTYCLIGDGESAEGSIWEALSFAGVKNLDKLCVIIDVNKFGQSQETAFAHDLEAYKVRLDSFGFNTLVVDGHDVEALCKAFHEVGRTEKPTAIVAKTFKGKGFPGIEDEENWHGKALGDKSDAVIAAITGRMKNPAQEAPKPKAPANDVPKVDISNVRLSSPPSYKVGEKVATRVAYGSALKKLAETCSRVVALDGDMKNSTYANAILKVDPTRFIECFIAEQNLVGVGIGVACRDRAVVFCSSFSAFFTRAFDQLRMGAISQTNINVVGSHGGISIGEDGPSQMALEDIALFRSIPTATVFYPTDAVSCERAAELAANTKGICFIRVTRPGTSVLYPNDEQFQIGKAKIVQQSGSDVALVIAAGITLEETLGASKILATKGIKIRIMDPFTIKPIDEEAIKEHAKACGGRIVVVEDHYPEGGLGEAVKSAVAEQRDIIVHHLAVREVPKSGPPMELLDIFGISAKAIAAAVLKVKDM